MDERLTDDEMTRFEHFVTTCLADPGSYEPDELVCAINENADLCSKALTAVRRSRGLRYVTEQDLIFLKSWLKAGDLILGSLEVLRQMDSTNAAAIGHELECTQTALETLPRLILEAYERR